MDSNLQIPCGDSLWFRAPRRPPGLTGRALSTAQWPAIPLRLGSGGFVEGGAGVERCCAAQIAGMSIVVWATAMHRAAVVPNHEIAGPPFMAVDEFGPGCVESEVVQQYPPVGHRPTDDVRGVRRQVQCLTVRSRMMPHQPLA